MSANYLARLTTWGGEATVFIQEEEGRLFRYFIDEDGVQRDAVYISPDDVEMLGRFIQSEYTDWIVVDADEALGFKEGKAIECSEPIDTEGFWNPHPSGPFDGEPTKSLTEATPQPDTSQTKTAHNEADDSAKKRICLGQWQGMQAFWGYSEEYEEDGLSLCANGEETGWYSEDDLIGLLYRVGSMGCYYLIFEGQHGTTFLHL